MDAPAEPNPSLAPPTVLRGALPAAVILFVAMLGYGIEPPTQSCPLKDGPLHAL